MIPKPYYEEHKEYLSEKLRDQYDTDKGDLIVISFIVIITVVVWILGVLSVL